MRGKLSAFVITYNRAWLLETCLRAVSFADELIVVDKSSTDDSPAIAARYADRVEVVPWSPTVEETRAFAASLCQHEWVLCLDDDEILSPEAALYLRDDFADPETDIYSIPYRHYILGEHDERAYYWPETRHCLFRRGAVEFLPTVHGGVALQSDRITNIPVDSGVCIHHLSHADVASWIERTNRYTARPDRVQVEGGEGDLIGFAHGRIDDWMRRTGDPSRNDYPAAVALLRAIYDMVDRLKSWEVERGLDGAALFRIARNHLASAIDGRDPVGEASERDTRANREPMEPSAHGLDAETPPGTPGLLVRLRATEAQLRERSAAERACAKTLAGVRDERDETIAALTRTRDDLAESRATAERTGATLQQTRDALDRTSVELDRTRSTLDQARAALDQTQGALDRRQEALDQTQAALGRTRTSLAALTLEFEQLGNSGRLFMRQYLPKLRRHLLPWLA